MRLDDQRLLDRKVLTTEYLSPRSAVPCDIMSQKRVGPACDSIMHDVAIGTSTAWQAVTVRAAC